LFGTNFLVSRMKTTCMKVMGVKHIQTIESWCLWFSCWGLLHFPLISENHKWSSYCSKDALGQTMLPFSKISRFQVQKINIHSCWRWRSSLITYQESMGNPQGAQELVFAHC
jgi:hypothetical protein